MGRFDLIEDLPENFLIMNGDFFRHRLWPFLWYSLQRAKIFSISSSKREQVSEYGVLGIDDGNNLIEFKEKPKEKFLVSMGIYMASRRIIDIIPSDRAYGFDHLVLDLIGAKKFPKVRIHSGYWLDIGRPDDYAQAIEEYESKKGIFLK